MPELHRDQLRQLLIFFYLLFILTYFYTNHYSTKLFRTQDLITYETKHGRFLRDFQKKLYCCLATARICLRQAQATILVFFFLEIA
ncbi:hypothetical protein BGP_5848 [Beggiatoa sp. PS]|nr:hypothetical protein BGP_5848 [Beggiatoa sp. PS]